MDDPLEQFKQTFFGECEELLEELQEQTSILKDEPDDTECLHAAFRAIHSIKGGAGAFGFDRLVSFAHTFENVFDLMRDGKLEITDDLVELSLRASDILEDLVGAAKDSTDLPDGHEQEVLEILKFIVENGEMPSGDDALTASAAPDLPNDDDTDELGLDFTPVAVKLEEEPAGQPDEGSNEEEDELGLDFTPVAVQIDTAEEPASKADGPSTYQIVFKPSITLYQRANDPKILIGELMKLGDLQLEADASTVPDLDEIDPDASYINWTLSLKTDASREDITDVFEFVLDDCELLVSEQKAGENQASESDATPAIEAASPQSPETPLTSDISTAEEKPVAPVPAAANPAQEAKQPQKTAQADKGPKASLIRVNLEKIDKLVNMVGELVITQSMLTQEASSLSEDQYSGLHKGLEQLQRHTRDLQDSVMSIRAHPVKSVFGRMPRIVRDVCIATGKKVRLETEGENTELDNSVVEQLSDPLTHMVRNSIDHGIESPSDRLAAGKPEEGLVILSAEHQGENILIHVRDDGKGIDREKVRQRAIEKGVIQEDDNLAPEELDQLVFAPGFSTAESVTNVSGRGVGMDVVRQRIQDLGGRIRLTSVPGKGSEVTLILPLTLAILDGMILRVSDTDYVMPITSIVETVRPQAKDLHSTPSGMELLRIRGKYVPLVYLSRELCVKGGCDNASEGLVVLCETSEGAPVGIVIDDIVGQQQVVIKSLREAIGNLRGISAATVLGNGRVALILNVTELAGGLPTKIEAELAPAA